jgi:DNA-binding MarR family transcriptional regulator
VCVRQHRARRLTTHRPRRPRGHDQAVSRRVTTDLEQRGYLEGVPDPADGRAKIIRLTDRGREAQAIGRGLIEDIERGWGERFGTEPVAALRDALEAITDERLGAVPV